MSVARHLGTARATYPFHVMIKGVGPICNIDCKYCYYLEKTALFPGEKTFRMDDALLEEFIRGYLRSHPGPTVLFPWHGGEPTMLGLDFFRKAVALQQKYLPKGWSCVNVPQTNGTLLTDEWCRFFKEHGFAIGLSMDGPAHLHDAWRVDKRQRPTHARVLAGLKLLQQHGVPVSVLCTVNSRNVKEPLAVYDFFRAQGVRALQFIPIVRPEGEGVSEHSVDGAEYGRFLTTIFDAWLSRDVGTVWVQIFDEALAKVRGETGSLCIFQETCGDSLALEHNGDLFACDHYVLEDYKLGNVREKSLKALVESPRLKAFARAKRDDLPGQCRACEVRFMCNGGCPKDRIRTTAAGEPGLNHLCEGFYAFFTHARPRLERLDKALKSFFRGDDAQPAGGEAPGAGSGPPKRNDPCPCGSGRKYKVCCMRAARA